MSTRNEVRERRSALRDDIRVSYKKGLLRAGMPVPSVRELATRFGLSKQVAHQEVQRMVEEGLLYSVPGSGTFIGTPPTRTHEFFLLVDADLNASVNPLSIGFAQRIAVLGGATLSLPQEEIRQRNRMGALPSLAGVWDSSEGGADDLPWGPLRREVFRVGNVGHMEDPAFMDGVGVDDFEGGQQATAHLVRLGHRRIAFLGVHSGKHPAPLHTAWSERREAGWRSILEEADLPWESLSFHPDEALAPPEQGTAAWSLVKAAENAARYLAMRSEITAVVAANDDAALALVRVLHALKVPLERWPALVGYDNLPNPKGQILSSLHRPLDKVGAAAADILWDRWQSKSKNESDASPVRHLIPMVLLPRITSESGWAARMPDVASLLLDTGSS